MCSAETPFVLDCCVVFFFNTTILFSTLSHLLESLRRSALHVSGRFSGPRQTISHQSLLQTPPGLVHLQLLLPEETETQGIRKRTARERKGRRLGSISEACTLSTAV